jgi:hypothetical protein
MWNSANEYLPSTTHHSPSHWNQHAPCCRISDQEQTHPTSSPPLPSKPGETPEGSWQSTSSSNLLNGSSGIAGKLNYGYTW